MKCKTESCSKEGNYRGWCSKHYDEYRTRDNELCSEYGCTRKAQTRGMCQIHYVNWYRRARPAKVMDTKLKHLYGITLQQYAILYEAQKGLCAICSQQETKIKDSGEYYPLSVDHVAETGAIRGLLCSKCNLGIGAFQHDIELFEKVISYLKQRPKFVQVVIDPEDMIHELREM